MELLAHLRSESVHRNLRHRQAIRRAARHLLEAEGFGEFETPVLGPYVNEYAAGNIGATTPAGERLWLAQSPQVYKQMLIATGYRRYYQFAHCFRDEQHDPGRGDRLREFIQLDVELETTDLEPVIDLAERLVVTMATAVGIDLPAPPFPRMTVRQALRDHGTDRPDLRSHPDEPAILCLLDFPMAVRDHEDRIALDRHPMAQPYSVPGTPDGMLDLDTRSFDLVLNGVELLSGGLRIHDATVQRHVLDLAAMDPAPFGELLHTLTDCPPHGGFGLGLDRLCMQLLHTDTIADVAPFPARTGLSPGRGSGRR